MGVTSEDMSDQPGVELVEVPAAELDMFDRDKEKCLVLYMTAHEKNANHYTKKAAKLEGEANSHNDVNTKAVYQARADELRRVRDKTNFTDWFEEDKKLFKQFDLDGNGFMDKTELNKFAEKNFHMTESEAKDVFKKWDIDEGKEIGPFEFVILMAVWHGEFAIQQQRCMDDFVIGSLANAMPCSCWLITAHTASNLATDNGELMEKAAEEAAVKALDKTKEVLIKGPAGRFKNVLTQDQTVSSPRNDQKNPVQQ